MTETPTSQPPAYQVLARKYRPETFADLVGQDAMVRTLKNAFAADRIAQAFIMTGIRGTGKTTTARIIAKGMNCIGPDGTGGPTTEPCGVCEHCVAISEGRHVDVMEMDAASRTGVGDIREIIESVHYRAASARYKIYIIDEVHMLSTSAFNALLKTLEEPPPHVKFIFATTEIRKVPVTVLSRCQRFDLRRIEPEVMIALLKRIAGAEGAQITEDALALITRAAEGSARDATSLLDQAISHGAGETTADQVRAMLGLADRGRVLDLFEMILRGDAAAALTELQSQYADGADPVAVLRDLAEVTHWISVVKITPDALDDPTISPDERTRGKDLSDRLPMRVLSRMWQLLLKALEEVSAAPNAMMATEMALIRLTHVADLPDPEALIRRVQQAQAAGEFTRGPALGAGAPAQAPQAMRRPRAAPQVQPSGAATALAVSPVVLEDYPDFASVVDLIARMRDMTLLVMVERHVALVRYSPGRIEFEPRNNAPADLAQRLAERLRGWTGGQRWAVTVTNTGGAPTIAETREAEA
ncbi:MAG: DNA polymerase III subunit gamma/tau, partial [Alphaproteobacteria bacterium]|nr:DNA polymerase III subunit gamma/tau [Alphaproteobacteria bacterium]